MTAERETLDAAALQKHIRTLSKQLARSEGDRAELEISKEKNDALLRKVIAELNESQADLNEKGAQLRKTLAELNATQNELIQSAKMAALGELVAGIAHEINTPIGVSVTAASHLEAIATDIDKTLNNDDLTRDQLQTFLAGANNCADMILRNLSRAADLVQSFKQIAVDRSFEGPRDFAVGEYLGNVLSSISAPLKKTHIRATLNGPEDLLIHSDPGLFSQVITNLVMNSLAHAYEPSDHGAISIDFQADGDCLELKYHDDGNGIDASHLPRIFEPFFTTKRGRGGSGLGLSIVHNIVVAKLKGSISCESTLGAGATFILRVPGLQSPRTADRKHKHPVPSINA